MKPYDQPDAGFNVGDCMPFWHDDTFHLFYLLDREHHGSLGGVGGHQWAHVSTRNLVHWEEHPLALACSECEPSICTGSMFHHGETFYAFCAIRQMDYSQHFGQAVSGDGIHFRWTEPSAVLVPPPGYSPYDFRDPFVFEDHSGVFHLLLTSRRDPDPLHERGGCLLRFTSPDLESWQFAGPFLTPAGGTGHGGVPECPDLFEWNGWYYLLFGLGFRTHYRMARDPLGPWLRPAVDTLDTRWCAVMKTAAFGAGRRIGTAWIGPRQEEKDTGDLRWGGAAVFREMVQRADGTLGMRFVPEMMPETGEPWKLAFQALTPGAASSGDAVEIRAADGLEAGFCELPAGDARIRCRVVPAEGTAAYGLGLRGVGNYERQHDLRLDCRRRTLSLSGETQPLWGDPSAPGTLDVILTGSIIDVCYNDGQTLINRCYETDGNRLFFWCEDGAVRFEDVRVSAWNTK